MRSHHARASGSRSRVCLSEKNTRFHESAASWYAWRLLLHLDELANTHDERSNLATRLLDIVGVENEQSSHDGESVLALIGADEPAKMPLEGPYGRNLH